MILFVVADDFGQAELDGKLVVTLLHLFETVNHCKISNGMENVYRAGAVFLLLCCLKWVWETGGKRRRRRAPLEEGRDGLVEGHVFLFLS